MNGNVITYLIYNLAKQMKTKLCNFLLEELSTIFADSQNTTLVFFAKASKGNRWTVKEQLIKNFISTIMIHKILLTQMMKQQSQLKNNKSMLLLFKQHKILQSLKISSLSLKFRLAGLTTDYINPVYIYLVPGNESIGFKLNDPPEQIYFKIEPLIGESLDYFNYTLSNLKPGNSISFYYYFENSVLENDVNIQSIINGIPLIKDSKETFGQFQLPNGITNNSISVLCEISSSYGAKTYLKQEVYVMRKNYELQQLYQSFTNKTNLENLQSLHTMIALIQLEEHQVCLKQCSGVGTCVNKKCQCPPGYYFADCSGNQEQQTKFNDFMFNAMQSLIKAPIKNNDDMKLFSQTLYFLTQFSSNNTLSLEDCSIVLQQYIKNTNSRLEQINQFSINLQYQSTEDFNYSQIDIRSLVNKNDLHTALKSTVFMWEKTLFTSGSNVYSLQNQLNNLINNIIELTIFSLSPNDKVDFSIDTASITVQKSQSLPYNSSRVLEEINSQKSAIYDIVYAIYIRNFYAFDGYFPYPQQIYPLYDYQIRQSSRKENIQLDQPISYRFGIQNDTTNLVCLQRNAKTYEWFDQNCTISEINSTYYCNCTTLSPTTICNDYDFLYQGSSGFRISLPNIFYIVYIIQLIILGIFVSKSKTQNGEQKTEDTKFGRVFKLAKHNKVNVIGNQVYPVDHEKDTRELIIKPEVANKDNKNDKFHFNYFWKYHCLAQLIFKQLAYLSPFMRSLLILLRWNSAIIVGEFLSLIYFDYQISIWIIFASIVIMRLSENFLKKQIKYFFVMKQIILVILIKGFIFLLLVFTILCGIYFYLLIDDQTSLILSYSAAIIIDILLLDIIIFGSKRFLGENKKKNIRKKINELKQIAKVHKQND
ncbi:unnamed protein product (macronuclear) [Paramecium tetraurelia]|uniref:EGF-like domain-containing protein n=1 Tax=Paramecium tetraurelia TaxID=5888 RepID=A0CJP5_PARTE|nr:uncharacterized protein GSPATT00000724001 [Paramecium tetraurelia]CAK71012.1 unnamed protein product [Paramecium tetraurelia]|eukprot:XP_001438409.1 hypothetical protein (macronuclear) [Paramecium tetraurelia strain d4-2]